MIITITTVVCSYSIANSETVYLNMRWEFFGEDKDIDHQLYSTTWSTPFKSAFFSRGKP
jgi:hypothetical protein